MTRLTDKEWQQEMDRLRSRQRALLGRMVAMASYLGQEELVRWVELLDQSTDYAHRIQLIIDEYRSTCGIPS